MLLAIDSSSSTASAALLRDGVLLAEAFNNNGLTHSRTLAPMINSLLQNAGVSPGEISRVAVTNGPGSFTGLRIGISTALGFSGALGIPCSGVSTLMAAAFGAIDFEGTVCAAMDARRNQFYFASFYCENGALTRLTEDAAVCGDSLDLPRGPVCWTGDAAALLVREGDRAALRPYPSAYGAALCFLSGHERPAEQAVYLRMPQAERERLARKSEKYEKCPKSENIIKK